jgi:ATP-dependent DNA helicase RecQ
VKTVAKNSLKKVKIIQSIDKGMPLDDIAASLNMEFEDFLTEVERIVDSGTKININYFLEEVMDEEVVEDIYEYFRGSETDKISVALDELGDDYEEDEIRLVRIKFLSELAN